MNITDLEEEARERRQRIVEQNGNSALHYETDTTGTPYLRDKQEESEYEARELNTPNHYDNTNGSLYKIAEQRAWNSYQFDAIKRIDRVNKKGQFKEDIEKTIAVLKLMLNNQ